MNYYLYDLVSNSVRSQIKRSTKIGQIKKFSSWQKAWATLLKDGTIIPDIAAPVLISEQFWLENPVCLMPESPELIEQILKTNFEGQVNALRSEYEHFMVAIPKSTRFNGEVIKGVFISILDPKRKNTIIEHFANKYDAPIKMTFNGSLEKNICISYRDPIGNGMIVNNVPVWKLAFILEAESIEEFGELTRKTTKDDIFSIDLSKKEQKTQFDVIRFIIGFMVYMAAHKDHISSVDSLKMQGDKNTKPLVIKTIKHFTQTKSKSAHYRNLRHERFYQGEWETWEKGTRWVPVNMITKLVEDL